MNYVYPLLSKHDLFLIRIGGDGLGNILFAYARAISYSEKYNCKLIWPTWPSFKLGPFLRHEKDKRFYNNLFKNNDKCIGGLKKFLLLIFLKKVNESDCLDGPIGDNNIILFKGYARGFKPISSEKSLIKNTFLRNLHPFNSTALKFDGSQSICIHVRLGDFQRGTYKDLNSDKNNISIPLDWYCKMVLELRRILKRNISVYVFSDGSDYELEKLMGLGNITRISFGSSIADIIALSTAGILIVSDSTFSMWALYLSNHVTIMYPNLKKVKMLSDNELSNVIFADSNISDSYIEKIKASIN